MRRTGVLLLAILAIGTGWALRVWAQHEQHHGMAQAPQGAMMQGGQMSQGMGAGMRQGMGMCANMDMSRMHQEMMGQHAALESRITELLRSLETMQRERDITALRGQLAQHGELLKQLQAQIQQRAQQMQRMQEQMQNCPMMGQQPTPSPQGESGAHSGH